MVGVSLPEGVAEATLDRGPVGQAIVAVEAEHSQCPGHRVQIASNSRWPIGIARTAGPPPQMIDEGLIGRNRTGGDFVNGVRVAGGPPGQSAPDRSHRLGSVGRWQRPGRVDGTKHKLTRTGSRPVQLADHPAAAAVEPLHAASEPHPVALEPVAKPGLGYPPTLFQVVGQGEHVAHQLIGKLGAEPGADRPEENPSSPRAPKTGLAGQPTPPQGQSAGGSNWSGVKDLQLSQQHGQNANGDPLSRFVR